MIPQNRYIVRISNVYDHASPESGHYIVEAEDKNQAGEAVLKNIKAQNPEKKNILAYVMDLSGVKKKLIGNPHQP